MELTRRAFVGTAAVLVGGSAFGIAGPEGVMKTIGISERLYLVNTVARYRFEMGLVKEDAPVVLKDYYPGSYGHTVTCKPKEAIALTGVLVEGDPDVRIRICIDGEFILKDVSPAMASASKFPDGFTIRRYPGDLFLAETAERTEVGLFLPNGTRIDAFADHPARVIVTLRTALYTSKDPRPQEF